jgi:L-erythro-3,5-diaminohexanoate dehydrogenase
MTPSHDETTRALAPATPATLAEGAGEGDARPVWPGGDRYGTHRVLAPRGALPQPAWRLDNDFSRIFEGEVLLAVSTVNMDAASFAQIEEAARSEAAAGGSEAGAGNLDDMSAASPGRGRSQEEAVAHIVLRTVADRGKQHNPVTGSGGMLLGRVLQVAPGREGEPLLPGDRVATLASLTLTPLRIDRVRAVRSASAQLDVDGEAVVFSSAPCAKIPSDLPERLVLAVLDVAGAAPQVARRVRSGQVVVVLGAGGKSGVLCVAEARRSGGAGAFIVGVESRPGAADELRALRLCDEVVVADAREAIGLRAAILGATGGREADITFSCVNVPDAELSAVLATRGGGAVYFFAMSTSFTKAALGAEGLGKDVDLLIGNGFAHGHAEHTLAMLRDMPDVRVLFERRYT